MLLSLESGEDGTDERSDEEEEEGGEERREDLALMVTGGCRPRTGSFEKGEEEESGGKE